MDKRGEISSQYLVGIILTIIGFVIVGFVLYGLFKDDSLTDREACRLSILSRATVPSAASQQIPLNCFTEKICITTKEGFLGLGGKDNSCKQFAGEENVRIVKVSVNGDPADEKARQIIQREVANAMFDCWAMTGQGKLDIFSGSDKPPLSALAEETLEYASLSFSDINPKCIVCSRVAFSDSLLAADKRFGLFNGINYNDFMSREKVPGSSLTYLQAFTDESVGSGYGSIGGSEALSEYFGKTDLTDEDVTKIKDILRIQFNNQPGELNKIEGLDKPKLINYLSNLTKPEFSDQISIIFTQIKVPSIKAEDQYWNTFANGAIIGGLASISGPGKVASYLLPGPGWMKALYKIGSVGAVSWILASDAEATAKANQAISAASCGKFQSTVGVDQQGCSLVKLVNWDVGTVNGLCFGGIEGNL